MHYPQLATSTFCLWFKMRTLRGCLNYLVSVSPTPWTLTPEAMSPKSFFCSLSCFGHPIVTAIEKGRKHLYMWICATWSHPARTFSLLVYLSPTAPCLSPPITTFICAAGCLDLPRVQGWISFPAPKHPEALEICKPKAY